MENESLLELLERLRHRLQEGVAAFAGCPDTA